MIARRPWDDPIDPAVGVAVYASDNEGRSRKIQDPSALTGDARDTTMMSKEAQRIRALCTPPQ
jgi:hypothetical protein